jgi:hypothetical protein
MTDQVTLFCSSVNELNSQALSQLTPVSNDVPLSDYFGYAKRLLHNAGTSKQNRDIERTYMFMVQYLMYVVETIINTCQTNSEKNTRTRRF